MFNHTLGIETGFLTPISVLFLSRPVPGDYQQRVPYHDSFFSIVSLNIDFDMIIQKISRLEFLCLIFS